MNPRGRTTRWLIVTGITLILSMSIPSNTLIAQETLCWGVCYHNSSYTEYKCAKEDDPPEGMDASDLPCRGTHILGISCSTQCCEDPEDPECDDPHHEDQENQELQLALDGTFSNGTSAAVLFVEAALPGRSALSLRGAIRQRSGPCATRVVVARYYDAGTAALLRQRTAVIPL